MAIAANYNQFSVLINLEVHRGAEKERERERETESIKMIIVKNSKF